MFLRKPRAVGNFAVINEKMYVLSAQYYFKIDIIMVGFNQFFLKPLISLVFMSFFFNKKQFVAVSTTIRNKG